jgi:hypothetical protein
VEGGVMNWYKKAQIKKFASIDLTKLYMLFKNFSKGIEENDLLFNVYDDWLMFLKRGKYDVEEKLNEVYAAEEAYKENPSKENKEYYEDTMSDYSGLEDVLERIKNAIEIMEKNYKKSFKEKIVALNIAISIYHRDVSILERYLKRYYDKNIKNFLNWLHVQG